MQLKELILKLKSKPNQNAEVDFVIYEKASGNVVCIDLDGPKTMAVMKALATKSK